MSNRRIWWLALAANGLALVASLVAGAFGVTTATVLAALTIFVYLETFVAILWYTMETRRMQESVSLQAGLLAHSHRAALYDSMRNAMMQINQLFVTSPHLRPYFYDSVPFVRVETDNANTRLFHELSSVADCFLDVFESVHHGIRTFPEEVPGYAEAWGEYMRSVFSTSPFLNAHYDRHPGWYVAALQQYRPHRPPGTGGASAPNRLMALPT